MIILECVQVISVSVKGTGDKTCLCASHKILATYEISKVKQKTSSEFSGEKERDRQTETQRGEGRNKIPSLFMYYF